MYIEYSSCFFQRNACPLGMLLDDYHMKESTFQLPVCPQCSSSIIYTNTCIQVVLVDLC